MRANGISEGNALTRREWLAAMLIFLLPMLVPLFGILGISLAGLPPWVNSLIIGFLLATILFVLGIALLRGLPRWSLPYLGFLVMLGSILARYDRIWSWIYPVFIETFGLRSAWPIPVRLLYGGVFAFIYTFSILLVALLLVNVLRWLPSTRGIWRRIRGDWTELSFIYYGGLIFAIHIIFDEYHYDDIWKLMAWISLALGAWLYLRAEGHKQRLLAILGGATAAMWLVALAKYVLIPLQAWPTGYPIAPSVITRWTETGGALVDWLCFMLMLLAPAALDLLPGAPGVLMAGEEEPIGV